MYGVLHDDYDYSGLNKYLTLIHKVVLKKLACFPERLTVCDFQRIREYEQMSIEDIVHYSYIVFEGKPPL